MYEPCWTTRRRSDYFPSRAPDRPKAAHRLMRMSVQMKKPVMKDVMASKTERAIEDEDDRGDAAGGAM